MTTEETNQPTRMDYVKYWAKSINMDLFFASLFILWKLFGVEGAGNVFMLLIWAVITIGFIGGAFADKTTFKTKRPPGFIFYHRLTDFAVVCALAFYGMFVMAGMYAVAHLLLEAAREREPKKD